MLKYVHHVHYVVENRDVDDIQKVAKALPAKGNKLRGQNGIHNSPLGYLTVNIDRASSHGMFCSLRKVHAIAQKPIRASSG